MSKKKLPQEALKLVACITMFIDHFGHAIVPGLPVPYMVELYYACRIIGRIAFPIYAFLLCEGMRYTRNPQNYILRLGVGILLAELPFDILFEGGISWATQSVMVTLTLGALMLFCLQKAEKKWMKLLIVLLFGILADLARSDYGGWGIAMIAAFAVLDHLPVLALGILLINAVMPSVVIPFFSINLSVQTFGAVAMVPISLYSGRKLTRSRALQWVFYLFYPVHLLILWMILLILR